MSPYDDIMHMSPYGDTWVGRVKVTILAVN